MKAEYSLIKSEGGNRYVWITFRCSIKIPDALYNTLFTEDNRINRLESIIDVVSKSGHYEGLSRSLYISFQYNLRGYTRNRVVSKSCLEYLIGMKDNLPFILVHKVHPEDMTDDDFKNIFIGWKREFTKTSVPIELNIPMEIVLGRVSGQLFWGDGMDFSKVFKMSW